MQAHNDDDDDDGGGDDSDCGKDRGVIQVQLAMTELQSYPPDNQIEWLDSGI